MEQSKTLNLERLLKMNEKDQSFLLRYLSRLPLEYRLDIIQRHRRLIHKLKEQHADLEVATLSYGAMLLAIKTFYNEDKQLSKKRFEDMSLEEIGELTIRQIKTFDQKRHTSSPKRDTLIGYWAEVKTLKTMGKGFRYIAKFLQKKHRFEVGHTLIQTTWKQLEETK
ncbi:hypothetical protein Sulku_1699 [Sulfuricurvum kujiense DSM 16994]|uniref:Uncharacterized protein n=1 Tax=Sulfuricurvum kujiense (strain ATCC BAA-921 / DSM 16994 / JCM 11577 / YK-1) TaxID=709032 RepID=E4U0P3_SULKY|nr:hypothetical protein [Sulfuricurvum kujiense]ADR34360.1 hypothetical protein Sulku_1699 [Sulfuricurvum kujiense DSM 16994]